MNVFLETTPFNKHSYNIKTSQLICLCFANQLTGFYMIQTFNEWCF